MDNMTPNLIYIFLGGGSGAVVRYLVSFIFKQYYPTFPVGTLFVNILGSFLIGLFMVFLENKIYLKSFFVIGFLGGLTTFSTFSYESIFLIKSERWMSFVMYVFSNLLLGFGLAFVGYGWGSRLNAP